ncbi:MAG: lytic transglycosylase domain-containing protein [Acidobacteria bacterium]|nr:lytic transglycosylase domain-containing protein [Acidobacteriota bacterium]
MMEQAELRLLIVGAAMAYSLEPDLVEAVVQVESGGNPFAWNPEPKYRWLYNVRTHQPFRALTQAEASSKTPPLDFPVLAGDRDNEWLAQQASWGLMQVMGAVARELGCKVPYLPELTQPDLNLDLGCRHLASHLKWAQGNVRKALGAYNAGRGGAEGTAGQAYSAHVLAGLDAIRRHV